MSQGDRAPQVSRARLLRRTVGAWRIAQREPAAGIRVCADGLGRAESDGLRVALSDALDRSRPPGAQLAVRRRGVLLWAVCAGRVDRHAPVAADDRFVLASSTKLVTACLVAMLAERGQLRLDDPVANWLPELPNARQLTAGLPIATATTSSPPSSPSARADATSRRCSRSSSRGRSDCLDSPARECRATRAWRRRT